MTAALRRLGAATRLDLRLQRRAGVHVAVVLMALVWVAVLRALPVDVRRGALPVVVALDLATVGSYIMAAAVLFEKAQRTVTALAVTPLRAGEYLAAKVASLTAAAVVLAVVVVVAGYGGPVAVAPLLAGVVLTAVAALLGGFVLVAPHAALATYLLPSGLLAAVLVVPPVAVLAGAAWPLVALLPTGGAYALVAAATGDVPGAALAVAAVAQTGWLVALVGLALRAHRRHLSGGEQA